VSFINFKFYQLTCTCSRPFILVDRIWEILSHSEPFIKGHPWIINLSNLERRCMAVELGRYLRFLQSPIWRYWREERLANHSGKASSNSSPSKSYISNSSRIVRCWSWWGKLFSLSHPYMIRLLRDPLKLRCWNEFKTPAGTAPLRIHRLAISSVGWGRLSNHPLENYSNYDTRWFLNKQESAIVVNHANQKRWASHNILSLILEVKTILVNH